jgi:hypothetical protein
MCRLANAAFLGNGFARQPSLRNPLGLPPTWRGLIQWLFGLGGTKIGNIFQTRKIQQLHIKFCNECQMALLSG